MQLNLLIFSISIDGSSVLSLVQGLQQSYLATLGRASKLLQVWCAFHYVRLHYHMCFLPLADLTSPVILLVSSDDVLSTSSVTFFWLTVAHSLLILCLSLLLLSTDSLPTNIPHVHLAVKLDGDFFCRSTVSFVHGSDTFHGLSLGRWNDVKLF